MTRKTLGEPNHRYDKQVPFDEERNYMRCQTRPNKEGSVNPKSTRPVQSKDFNDDGLSW